MQLEWQTVFAQTCMSKNLGSLRYVYFFISNIITKAKNKLDAGVKAAYNSSGVPDSVYEFVRRIESLNVSSVV